MFGIHSWVHWDFSSKLNGCHEKTVCAKFKDIRALTAALQLLLWQNCFQDMWFTLDFIYTELYSFGYIIGLFIFRLVILPIFDRKFIDLYKASYSLYRAGHNVSNRYFLPSFFHVPLFWLNSFLHVENANPFNDRYNSKWTDDIFIYVNPDSFF